MLSARQLAVLYALVYGASGAFGPWLGLVLIRQGHAPGDVALGLSLMPATSIIAGPAWAWLADRARNGPRLLQWSTGGSALLGAGVALPLPGAALVPLLIGLGGVRSGIGLVLDAFTLRSLELQGADPSGYGRIRRWGSIGFVGGTATAAALDAWWVAAPLLLGAALWGIASARFASLPTMETTTKAPSARTLLLLARAPGLAWLLVALPLYGLGMTAYDAWYAVHVESMGWSSWWTAAAITVGISAEVVVLSRSTQIFTRVAPHWLVVGSMALGAVRWALVAWLRDPLLLTALHLSHGLVFGGFWVGAVEWLRRLAPIEVRASAQMALPVLGYGVGPVLTGLVARAVVPDHGTPALFVAASIAALAAAACAAIGARSAPAQACP